MSEPPPDPPGAPPAPGAPEAPDPGLCASCRHALVQRSRRGSRFWRCGLADRDARFPRYPPLPVRSCSGYRARPGAGPHADPGCGPHDAPDGPEAGGPGPAREEEC